jgi:hypothetical protein
MHPNDLPVVGQALSPANRIIPQLLSNQLSAKPTAAGGVVLS